MELVYVIQYQILSNHYRELQWYWFQYESKLLLSSSFFIYSYYYADITFTLSIRLWLYHGTW